MNKKRGTKKFPDIIRNKYQLEETGDEDKEVLN
jgi:hypothetical protein